MKRIPSLVVKTLIVAAVVTGLALTLQAQSNLEITADIPFSFIVGTRSIAPGNYQFSLVGSPFLLSVLNVKTGRQELFPVHPGSQQAFASNGCIAFQKSDSSNVLTELYFPGTDALTQVNGSHGARGSQTMQCSKSELRSQPLSLFAR